MMDALTWQCEGVPRLGTDFPAITARLTQHYAASQGKSIATIFVDAKINILCCDTKMNDANGSEE